MSVTREQFIREWVADLRSGKFTQCRTQLSNGTSYCCLGVACLTGARLGIHEAEFGEGQDLDNGEPGLWFYRLVGHSDPKLHVEGDDATAATHLNDQLGYDFDRIADAIVRTYPEAFAEAKP